MFPCPKAIKHKYQPPWGIPSAHRGVRRQQRPVLHSLGRPGRVWEQPGLDERQLQESLSAMRWDGRVLYRFCLGLLYWPISLSLDLRHLFVRMVRCGLTLWDECCFFPTFDIGGFIFSYWDLEILRNYYTNNILYNLIVFLARLNQPFISDAYTMTSILIQLKLFSTS